MLKKSLRHLSGLEANVAGEDGVVACEFARHASDVLRMQRTDGSPAREIIELLARLGVIFQRGIVKPENLGPSLWLAATNAFAAKTIILQYSRPYLSLNHFYKSPDSADGELSWQKQSRINSQKSSLQPV